MILKPTTDLSFQDLMDLYEQIGVHIVRRCIEVSRNGVVAQSWIGMAPQPVVLVTRLVYADWQETVLMFVGSMREYMDEILQLVEKPVCVSVYSGTADRETVYRYGNGVSNHVKYAVTVGEEKRNYKHPDIVKLFVYLDKYNDTAQFLGTYAFAKDDLEQIRSYVRNHSVEYGGQFARMGRNVDGKTRLVLNKKKTQVGNANTYTVVVPIHRYSWHTHPSVFYTQFQSALGWPSALDVRYLLMNYKHDITHFVFTHEGVYIVQVTPEARQIMNNMRTKQLESQIEAVRTYFRVVEKERTATKLADVMAVNPGTVTSLFDYIIAVNTVRFPFFTATTMKDRIPCTSTALYRRACDNGWSAYYKPGNVRLFDLQFHNYASLDTE